MTRVLFHTADVGHASGGVIAVYRMVDACRAAGIDAAVLHQRSGFRPRWFQSGTVVLAAQNTPVRDDDVLVMTELDAPRLLPRAPGVTKVVLNQHQYWTFSSGDVDYRHPDVASVIAVSDDGLRYLRCAFPGLPVHRLRYAVDTDRFTSAARKLRTVGYLATKGGGPRHQVLSMLRHRESLQDWQLLPLAGLSHAQMADALGEIAVFASFSEFEGFQILLTEAMAAGAAVVGFDAGGGREYLTEDVAWPVPAGEPVTFVERLEEVTALWDQDQSAVKTRTERAAALVASRYTLANEAADIVAALQPALDKAAKAPSSGQHQVADEPAPLDRTKRRLRAAGKALLRG